MSATGKRGPNPPKYTQAFEDDLLVLWTTTARTAKDITAELNERYGLSMTDRQVYHHARGRGLYRAAIPQEQQSTAGRVMALQDASLARWMKGQHHEDRVKHVPRGTYPNAGYKTAATR